MEDIVALPIKAHLSFHPFLCFKKSSNNLGSVLNDFGKGKKNPIISFFQYSLTFNITSITFITLQIKKLLQNKIVHFSIPNIFTFLFLFFLKKKSYFFHINQFLLQHQTETETKSFTKPTLKVLSLSLISRLDNMFWRMFLFVFLFWKFVLLIHENENSFEYFVYAPKFNWLVVNLMRLINHLNKPQGSLSPTTLEKSSENKILTC